MDSWSKWNVVCLGALSLEDIEDFYIFGSLIAGVLMIGIGMALIYRKIGKLAAKTESPKLSAVITHHCGAIADQVKGLQQKVTQIEELLRDTAVRSGETRKRLDQICDQSVDTPRRLDTIMNMFSELGRNISTQAAISVTRLEEVTRGLSALQRNLELGGRQD
ncbi:hypothetical protein D5F01_LYC09032 [Larimichthys crocea]|uniref:Uncharacterized protein n=1 Tax=Larimichthys crocea TaxID=215358 RepID=A0A6G0IJI4_LARCR|nr:hypothetical protein D5F01_LYC09032 [Larimichthys crocea]